MELPSPLVADPALQQNFDALKRRLAILDVIHSGIGSPENVVTAPVGHIYLDADGGSGSTFYVKEADSGAATGWAAHP